MKIKELEDDPVEIFQPVHIECKYCLFLNLINEKTFYLIIDKKAKFNCGNCSKGLSE